jgi:hypothetical protein
MTAFFAPFGDAVLGEVSKADACRAVDEIRAARETFKAFRRRGVARDILEQYIFAADTMEMAADKVVAFHELQGAGKAATASRKRRYVAAMKRLQARFRELWLARNRPSEMRITLKRYAGAMR